MLPIVISFVYLIVIWLVFKFLIGIYHFLKLISRKRKVRCDHAKDLSCPEYSCLEEKYLSEVEYLHDYPK